VRRPLRGRRRGSPPRSEAAAATPPNPTATNNRARDRSRRGRLAGGADGGISGRGAANATDLDAAGRRRRRRALLQSGDGDGSNPFNLGATLVHEVGHWLGLEHTFEGGCSQTNDGVADTPAIRQPTQGCPASRPDTCPSLAGVDQYENYMDYSDDRCMSIFTAGQNSRMIASYEGLRVGI
jgi:hypothetical protein